MTGNSKLYEKYHNSRNKLKRVISNKDITYIYLTDLIDRYTHNSTNALDIGCGVGTLSLYLAKLGVRCKGIDISRNAISIAKNNAQTLKLTKKASFEKSSFPSKSLKGKYDLIICSEVLEHLVDDYQAVTEIHKLLKRGGVAILTVPSKNAPLYRLGMLDNFDKEVGHLRRYSKSSLKTLVNTKNFTILEFYTREGILRNFLYTNKYAGHSLKIINRTSPFIFTKIDEITVAMFGESDLQIVIRKNG